MLYTSLYLPQDSSLSLPPDSKYQIILNMLWLSTLFCLSLGLESQDNVLVLQEESFLDSIKGKEALVLFFDPSCGSGSLALYEFTLAAKSLPPSETFVMAKINTVENDHAAIAFKVNTTPKLLYITAVETSEFAFTITSQNILEYVEAMINPKLQRVAVEKLGEFLAPGIVSFVLFEEEGSKLEQKIARSLRFEDPVNIGMCTDAAAIAAVGAKERGFYAINTYHSIVDRLEEFTYESIVDFVVKRSFHKKLPLGVAYSVVIEKELPAVYLFRSDNYAQEYDKIVNDTIASLGDFRIVFGDLETNIVFSRIIGLPVSAQPSLMLIEPVGNSLLKYTSTNPKISKDRILDLISSWKNKTAKRYYKSSGPIKGELTGLNYERIMENTVSDTLVHFYAPWCPHCKALDEELDKVVQNMTSVKVLKMNAEDNEVPGHFVEEYPTLKFYYPITKKWFEFEGLKEGLSSLDLWERIVEFVKLSRRDKRSPKSTEKEEL